MLTLSLPRVIAASRMMPRTATPDSSLAVDRMILDYLFFRATKGLLAERRAAKSGQALEVEDPPDAVLQMIQPFITLFRNNHGDHAIDATAQVRLRLLKFTTFFTRRYTQNLTTMTGDDLDDLRQTNAARASEYWAGEEPDVDNGFSNLQLDRDSLLRTRKRFVAHLNLHESNNFYGRSALSMSLLDLLPQFLALSAAQAQLVQYVISDEYTTLAASFMMQAALEQYFVFGARGPDALKQAFAWGHKQQTGTTWSDESLVNHMFHDGDLHAEGDDWVEKRDGFMEILQPMDPSVPVTTHLKAIARKAPIENFEGKVLEYLESLLESLPVPALEQLETGQLGNLSREETLAFMQRVRYFDNS